MGEGKRKKSNVSLYPTGKTTTSTSCTKHYADNGAKMINDFEFVKVMGKGAYGKVKMARNQIDGNDYALKILSRKFLSKKRVGMTGNALQDVFREIDLQKRLHHPNICQMYEVIDDPEYEKLFLVFELMEEGAVRKGVAEQDPLPLDLCWKYFRDLVIGLEYLHEEKIIHRDIKPENLLLNKDGVLKISDFGVSVCVEDEKALLKRTAGSPAFIAPETCSGEEFAGRPVDVWAAGITLYVFVYGRCPFIAKSSLQIYNVIKSEPLSFPEEPRIPDELRDFMTRILDKNPETRLNIEQIRKHPWITKNGTCPLPTQNEVMKTFSGDGGLSGAKSPKEKKADKRKSSGGSAFGKFFGKGKGKGKKESRAP